MVDPMLEAEKAVAAAIRESESLFELAAPQNRWQAMPHARSLKDSLVLLMLIVSEARRRKNPFT
jgi:hypothetical protein